MTLILILERHSYKLSTTPSMLSMPSIVHSLEFNIIFYINLNNIHIAVEDVLEIY